MAEGPTCQPIFLSYLSFLCFFSLFEPPACGSRRRGATGRAGLLPCSSPLSSSNISLAAVRRVGRPYALPSEPRLRLLACRLPAARWAEEPNGGRGRQDGGVAGLARGQGSPAGLARAAAWPLQGRSATVRLAGAMFLRRRCGELQGKRLGWLRRMR